VLPIVSVVLLGSSATASATITTTLTPNHGSEQKFVVPPDVTHVEVTAIGGAGAGGDEGTGGGSGAKVTATLAVEPEQKLYVDFGGGGSAPERGGAGGGAADVRNLPGGSALPSLESRLLVAGGGGGSGICFFNQGGGGGSASGQTGQAGSGGEEGAGGGGGATTSAGGTAGGGGSSGNGGGHGELGKGGNGGQQTIGANCGAGGGGGGYYGGGGGGGDAFGGGGGGAGSSYVEPAATGASYASGAGNPEEVTFTYPGPVATASPAKLTFGEQPQQTVSAPKSVTITNTGVGPLYLYGLTFEGADEDDFLAGVGSCLGPVEEGASCKVSVRFDPQGEHARTAKLVIAGNTGEAPKTVELEGTGGSLPQGPTGATGAEGATGATGATGAEGAMGATGEPGTPGAAGATGPMGATGLTGATGTTGLTGATGPAGPAGATGPAGVVQLITCERRAGANGRIVQKCKSSPSSSPIKFAIAGLKLAASLSRGKVTFATGFEIGSGAETRLVLSPHRKIAKGRYVLTLKHSGVQSHETITIE
jgi:hypothetical protein